MNARQMPGMCGIFQNTSRPVLLAKDLDLVGNRASVRFCVDERPTPPGVVEAKPALASGLRLSVAPALHVPFPSPDPIPGTQ